MKTIAKLLAAALLAACTASALADGHYVNVNSTNATPPYTNWTTAATNIQDAVDAAVAGDEIVVTNGIYAAGGWAGNRVVVDKPLNLRSVNGPQFTTIDGDYSVRCVYLADWASRLSGFTLTNGLAGEWTNERPEGAGLRCQSRSVVVSNCVVSGNVAGGYLWVSVGYGGGAYGGTLNNCTLSGNSSVGNGRLGRPVLQGGGAYDCTLNNCTLSGNRFSVYGSIAAAGDGGGASGCTLNNCTLTDNWAGERGGGTSRSTLNNCTLSGNSAFAGGGAYYSILNNCTLSGNAAGVGGGVYYSTLNNCTLSGNAASTAGGTYSSTLNNCIVLDGSGNSSLNHCWTESDPLFVDKASRDLRLQSNSPCINAGLNAFAPAGPDLDGNPRIVGGTVDIGAYEFQSLDLVSFGVVSNRFGFNITGQSNWVVVLEASSDFKTWTPLTTNTLDGSPFPFRDPTPPNIPKRFFRARME